MNDKEFDKKIKPILVGNLGKTKQRNYQKRILERVSLVRSFQIDPKIAENSSENFIEVVKKIDLGSIRRKLETINSVFNKITHQLCFYASTDIYNFDKEIATQEIYFFPSNSKFDLDISNESKSRYFNKLNKKAGEYENMIMLPHANLDLRSRKNNGPLKKSITKKLLHAMFMV